MRTSRVSPGFMVLFIEVMLRRRADAMRAANIGSSGGNGEAARKAQARAETARRLKAEYPTITNATIAVRLGVNVRRVHRYLTGK